MASSPPLPKRLGAYSIHAAVPEWARRKIVPEWARGKLRPNGLEAQLDALLKYVLTDPAVGGRK